MHDDFDDADLAALVHQAERAGQTRVPAPAPAPAPATATTGVNPGVQQPKPQALPARRGPSSILVSPRQKGNPILNAIHAVPWEYSDIPADYVVGATSCALFLSLKYHRLHPEYIYSRIRALAGKYKLRVLLTMVDIENHEDSLRELSKTSLVNNLTLMLCWSAAEAGRYLSLFKTYEHTAPNAIRAQQATSYNERLVEFVTVPRSINKTDAISLVGNFGSIRAAVNALPEEISMIGGWGEKKVNVWCSSVREDFRVQKTKKRGIGLSREATRESPNGGDELGGAGDQDLTTRMSGRRGIGAAIPLSMVPSREATRPEQEPSGRRMDADQRPPRRLAEDVPMWEPGEDDAEALIAAAEAEEREEVGDQGGTLEQDTSRSQDPGNRPDGQASVSEGVMAALAKLRDQGT